MEKTMSSVVKGTDSTKATKGDLIVETKEQYNSLKLQTNRYKFTKEISGMLSDFAKLHQYEGSKDYKAAWKNWIKEDEVEHKLEEEKCRLIKAGMMDDVMIRLYNSSRYYYRKKVNTLDKKPKERKKYEGLSSDVLRRMDAQIIREINGSIDMTDEDKFVSRFMPAKSFEIYMGENPDSVSELLSGDSSSAEERRAETDQIMKRLKKTYKNRFYKIKVNLETDKKQGTRNKKQETRNKTEEV